VNEEPNDATGIFLMSLITKKKQEIEENESILVHHSFKRCSAVENGFYFEC
jgi:hypothetical protein